MKFSKSISIFLIVCLFTLGSLSCSGKTENETSSKGLITEKDFEIADEIAKGFINTFYTVDKSDLDFISELTNNLKAATPEEMNKLIFNNASKFKPYLTEGAYTMFLNNRFNIGRLEDADKNKYLSEVKSIKWERGITSEYFKRISYKCSIEILQKPLDGKEARTVILQKQIDVYKEPEGWRVLPDASLFITK